MAGWTSNEEDTAPTVAYRRGRGRRWWPSGRAVAWLGLPVALVVFALGVPQLASAAPVDCTTALDVPTCQNVRATVEALEALLALEAAARDVRVTGVSIPPGAFEERNVGELPVADGTLRELTDMDGETNASTKVRLSDGDRNRMVFVAWGVWFGAGVLLCLLFAPLWHRVWNFWA